MASLVEAVEAHTASARAASTATATSRAQIISSYSLGTSAVSWAKRWTST
jgi:hypothetical protein